MKIQSLMHMECLYHFKLDLELVCFKPQGEILRMSEMIS